MNAMKNTTAFRPNKGRYLVLPTALEALTTKIEGSEYTIESQKSIHEKPAEGTVVAKGKECMEYENGAVVLFGKYSGYEQVFDGVNYLILADTEILGERLVTPFDEPRHPEQEEFDALLRSGQPKFAHDPDFCDGKHSGPPCHPSLCWMKNPL